MASIIGGISSAAEAVSGLATLLFGGTGGVVLGEFSFQGHEVPEYISIGGAQQLTVHKLPGGERVVDRMGPDEADLEWSGTIIDGGPEKRARQLDKMRAAGKPLALHWGSFFYTVVIKSFSAQTYYGRVSYRISCLVLRNEANSPRPGAPTVGGLASGGISGALGSISQGLGQAASAIHGVVSLASGVIGQVANLASAVGLHVGFLSKAQEALGIAGGLSAQIGGIAAYGNATANTISAMSDAAAASNGGASAMGGVVTGIAGNAPSGSIVGGAADLQTATYAAGAQAQMQQAGDYSGGAAVAMAATSGANPATAVANTVPAAYSDPTPMVSSSGPPNSAMSYTPNTVNTSGDPTQALFLTKQISYDASGAATVSYQSQPAVAGQLTAADRKAAGF
jgi:hypothetical protein